MKKRIVEECEDILETAEEIAEEYFQTNDRTGKRIATLAIAKMLVELGR